MDYTQTTWTDDDGSGTTGTLLTAARLNNAEAGIKDAAQDSKQRGSVGSRPGAASGNKNWIWIDSTTGQISYSTGSAWIDIGAPKTEAQWAPSRSVSTDFSLANDNGSAAIPLSGAGKGWLAAPFTPGATGSNHGFDVYLGRDAGVTAGSVWIELWNDSSGSPGAVIASAAFQFDYKALNSGSVISFSAADLGITLNSGTTYWLVVRVTGVTGGNVNYGKTKTTTFGLLKTSTDGSTWAAGSRVAFAHYALTNGPVAATAPDPGIKSGALQGTSTRGAGVSGSGMYGAYGSSIYGIGLGGDSTAGPGVVGTSDSYAGLVGRKQSAAATADLLRLEDENAGALARMDSTGKLSLIAGLSSSGPVVTCTSSTRPGSPWTGLVIFETDTERVFAWNGTSWRLVAPETDGLQAGVIASSGGGEGQVSSLAVSGAGAVTFTAAAGDAWVSTAGILLRVAVVSGAQAPALDGGSSLPASGHTRGYGLEVDTQGVWHLVQLGADVTGTTTANGNTAIANADGVAATSGRLRMRTFAISNISGTFSLNAGTQHDRRPWARGAYATQTLTKASPNDIIVIPINTTQAIDATNLSMRIECSGVPIRLRLSVTVSEGASPGDRGAVQFNMDGSIIASSRSDRFPAGTEQEITDHVFEFTPAAGTHLFVPFAVAAGKTMNFDINSGSNRAAQFAIEEIIRQNANNGTA